MPHATKVEKNENKVFKSLVKTRLKACLKKRPRACLKKTSESLSEKNVRDPPTELKHGSKYTRIACKLRASEPCSALLPGLIRSFQAVSEKDRKKRRRVESAKGSVLFPFQGNSASFADRFDPLPVFEKDPKKTLFWHFETLVARGIPLSPRPYYLIKASERNKAADVARNMSAARAAACLFRSAAL